MDLSFVKQKLSESSNKNQKQEKVDYSKFFWKPKPGKYQIRIVPNKFRKEWPLREIQVHYGINKFPILALTNWNESDPVVEIVKQLRSSSEKEDWQLANKISPKVRYFAPVLVRGEEEKGVRLWEVGKLINDQLMGIASDEDYGDFTDVTDGRDFTVEAVKDVIAGREGIKCTLRIKPKTSPIHEDASVVKSSLEEQPDILQINRKYSFEQLKDIIQKFLSPSDDETTEVTTEEEPVVAVVSEKVSNQDKFEQLFND